MAEMEANCKSVGGQSVVTWVTHVRRRMGLLHITFHLGDSEATCKARMQAQMDASCRSIGGELVATWPTHVLPDEIL